MCKSHSKEGFTIFTHYTSRKGKDLVRASILQLKNNANAYIFQEENPNCAMTYYWEPFNRSVNLHQNEKNQNSSSSFQIRIEGVAEKLPFSVADDYFKKRPYDSKIGALCSNQSEPIESRDVLMNREKELKEKYPNGGDVPRPPQW